MRWMYASNPSPAFVMRAAKPLNPRDYLGWPARQFMSFRRVSSSIYSSGANPPVLTGLQLPACRTR